MGCLGAVKKPMTDEEDECLTWTVVPGKLLKNTLGNRPYLFIFVILALVKQSAADYDVIRRATTMMTS